MMENKRRIIKKGRKSDINMTGNEEIRLIYIPRSSVTMIINK